MKQFLKLAPLAGALALTLSNSASADVPMSDFERDMRMAFENDGEPMELAMLSEKEMRETQGAFWPFKISWIGRLFWGASYGWLETGTNVYNRGNYGDIRTLYYISSAQLMAYSLIGLANTHPGIGVAMGFAADKSFDSLQQIMWENNWSIFDAVGHAATLVNRRVADILRSGGGSSGAGGPEAMSADSGRTRSGRAHSGQSDASKYLVGLLAALPQDRLRQFLSDIPVETFNRVLSDVAPDATRADFLSDLPHENVNDFLAAMPEEYVPDFRGIVPTHILDRLTTATAATSLANNRRIPSDWYWRY